MSTPSEDQVIQLAQRFATILNEWDDSRYVLAIHFPDGGFVTAARCSDRQKIVLIRCLIEEILELPKS